MIRLIGRSGEIVPCDCLAKMAEGIMSWCEHWVGNEPKGVMDVAVYLRRLVGFFLVIRLLLVDDVAFDLLRLLEEDLAVVALFLPAGVFPFFFVFTCWRAFGC